MANFDRFMIAPINTGLETDLRPFLIPDDAFARLINAYVFRGRVRKRFGSRLMNENVSATVAQQYSRLRVQVGTLDVPISPVPGTLFKIGQMFSVGDQMFTVYQLGTPAAMLATGPGTGTYNTTTGAFVITGTGLVGTTPIYFYPAEPVMGLITYESNLINDEPVFAFDTQFAYQFTGGAWSRLGTGVWTGSNSQFFWGDTYRGVANSDYYLFVTNFNAADLIKYWDGAAWNDLTATTNAAGDTLLTGRMVVPFKDRLLVLNTIEEVDSVNQSYVNRARFSQNGSPVASDAWRDDIPGRGGYLDAPTKEAIVTSEFLKDRLIVYFERSTWEIVYTGNEILPFRWQQINTELGAESTFSTVPFDKVVLGIGQVGVHACNGSNVERIDQKIPDSVFEISNQNEGVFRVYGIRDYFTEMVYWSFPSEDRSRTFPNRVLIFNYKTGSWAFNQDSITAFGYFQDDPAITWRSTTRTWEQSKQTWNSATMKSQFRDIIAGNQEGFIFIVDPEWTRNAPALQITNVSVSFNIVTITAINHNLTVGEYVIIEEAQGLTGINGRIVPVYFIVNDNTFQVQTPNGGGTYTGGGTIARVSNINILTKQYNFYLEEGRNMFVSKVDFYMKKTFNGAFTVDSFISSSTESLLEEGGDTGALLGTGMVETSPYPLSPIEQTQDRLWHPIYLQADGECIQLRLYMSDEQMRDFTVTWEDFELNAMTFYVTPTASRMQ